MASKTNSKMKCPWCYKDWMFYQKLLRCMFSHIGEKPRVICSECQLIKHRPWEMRDARKHGCAKPIDEGGKVFTFTQIPYDLTNVYETSCGLGVKDIREVEHAYIEFCMERRPTRPTNQESKRREAVGILALEARKAK